MKVQSRTLRFLSVLVFSAGVFLGIALLGGAAWGDLEATFFDVMTSRQANAHLTTLSCPVLMTATEAGTVAATFKNPTDIPIDFLVRAHISEGYLTQMREVSSRLPLAPGESQRLEWAVTSDDVVYGHLILVRVFLVGHSPLPARQGSCGVLVLDLPYLTGNQLFVMISAASLLCMMAGAGLLAAENRTRRRVGLGVNRAMVALAGLVVVGMIVSLIGGWLLGVATFVIAVLVILGIVAHFLRS
jgi:hypothetical protein